MSYTQSIHEKVNIEIINIERQDGDEGRSLESTFYLSLSGIMELSKQANFEVTQLQLMSALSTGLTRALNERQYKYIIYFWL